MIIWFIHHHAVSPGSPGGTRHFSTARWLVRQGHVVRIVASSFHYSVQAETREFAGGRRVREVIDGVTFEWIKTRPYRGNSVGRLVNMVSYALRALATRPDPGEGPPEVVMGSSPQPFAALAGLRLARRHGARFVYEVRDLWPQTLVELGRTSRWNPVVVVFGWIERLCLRRADRVVTLLPGSVEYLVAHGAARDRVTWVPNGVDLRMAGPVRPAVDRQECVFLYAGAIGVANGLDAVLDAAALLATRAPAVRIEIMGQGPERHRLEARAAERDLANVWFRDAVPKARVHEVLAEADAFLMILTDSPVFRHGISPNKLFDYMAAGRPVVFAVNTPIDPVADAGAGVRADPSSPESLAAAMEGIAALSRAEREAMGRRGRQYVEEHHDVEGLAARFGSALSGASLDDHL